MASISVDTVYKTVLSILNKEQRGYITPYEFNTLGEQAQLEIFEGYFESLNQQIRVGGNSSEYSDRVKLLEEKISRFEVEEEITIDANGEGDLTSLSDPVHRLGFLNFTYLKYLPVEIEEITSNKFNKLRRSKLTTPTLDWPVFYKQGLKLFILPKLATNLDEAKYDLNYIKKPSAPVWNYTVGGLGQYIFDPISNGVSKNFQIDDTDQVELILSILRYAGVVIKDTEVVQIASGLVNQMDQQQST